MRQVSLFMVLVALATFTSSIEAAMRDHSHAVKFRRQAFDKSKYPPPLQPPPKSSLPQDWVNALESLQKSGKIPNIPPTIKPDGIQYPAGTDSKSTSVCNWSINNCFGPNDIHSSPDGTWTISFDDGPTASSEGLYDFLHSHNQPGTHFMIGSQILAYPDAAKYALTTQQQLAVHTWSHQLQTTQNNYEILGDLGWNMQIIYDLTGRVPKYWRPPQGNLDNRVRAIAEQVFNLTTVMWDAECNDWCLQDTGKSACPGETPGKSYKSVKTAIKKALNKPKSPGITLLEHELNKYTVKLFTDYYPSLTGLGWKPMSVPDQWGVSWYHNAVNNSDTPVSTTSMVYSTIQNAISKSNGQPISSANSIKNSTTNASGGNLAKSSSSSSILHIPAISSVLILGSVLNAVAAFI